MEPSASAFLGLSISVYRGCRSKDWYCLLVSCISVSCVATFTEVLLPYVESNPTGSGNVLPGFQSLSCLGAVFSQKKPSSRENSAWVTSLSCGASGTVTSECSPSVLREAAGPFFFPFQHTRFREFGSSAKRQECALWRRHVGTQGFF